MNHGLIWWLGLLLEGREHTDFPAILMHSRIRNIHIHMECVAQNASARPLPYRVREQRPTYSVLQTSISRL